MFRRPAEESLNLYPGLVIDDDRVSGSITAGRSRLPLWAIVYTAIRGTWNGKPSWPDTVESNWMPTELYGLTERAFAEFLYHLLELRGEWGRLLLLLANAERLEQKRGGFPGPTWYETKKHRRLVSAQLRRCLALLEETDAT